MAKLKRIVCYAVNGSGLGHVSRLMAIARWLKRYVSILQGRAPEILFLTSTEATSILAAAGFPAFKIPSKTVARQGSLDRLEYRRLAKHFIWNTLGVFSPDLLIVDTFPSGSFDELFQVLDGPFYKSLIYRRVRPEYAQRPTFRSAVGLYDAVVVPHRRSAETEVPIALDVQVDYCGEVIGLERTESRSADSVRAELGIDNDTPLLYVSAGGGGDPGTETALCGLVELLLNDGDPTLHLLVGAGPLYRGRRVSHPRLTWYTDSAVSGYFSACDGAVSAGGYNTFHELLYFQVPTLFFAQEKVADDQLQRIREAAAAGACRELEDLTDHAAVLTQLTELLRPDVRRAMAEACARFIPDNGAARCARALLKPFFGEQQLARAAHSLPAELAADISRMDGESELLCRWLPSIAPIEFSSGLSSVPEFERLLENLSPDSRSEVDQALSQSGGVVEQGRLIAAFRMYLQAVDQHAIDNELLLELIEVARKKHPLKQEAHKRRNDWLIGLLNGLTRLLTHRPSLLADDDVIRLYRVFPRLTDSDMRTSFDKFFALIAAQSGNGDTAQTVSRSLQQIKYINKRVLSSHLDSMISGGS